MGRGGDRGVDGLAAGVSVWGAANFIPELSAALYDAMGLTEGVSDRGLYEEAVATAG